MKKRAPFALFLFLASTLSAMAQTYEQQIEKCKDFISTGVTFEKMEMQMKQLKECLIGLQLPLFSATDIYGNKLLPDDQFGKIVLICYCFADYPCKNEKDFLLTLKKQIPAKDFLILSFYSDSEESTREFTKSDPPLFPSFANSTELIQDVLKLQIGYPMKILLDRERNIIDFSVGGIDKTQASQLQSRIKKELSK